MSRDDDADIEASRAPLLEHLTELRSRLIVCIAALAIGFVVCFLFSQQIYFALLRPYQIAESLLSEQRSHHSAFDLLFAMTGIRHISAHGKVNLVYTAPLEFFFTKVKMAGFGALAVCFPVIAWQLYRFVAPGLYRRERNAFLPFLLAAPILFLCGAALVYFVMLPFVLWFSLSQQIVSADVQVQLLPKVSDYLDLVTHLLLAFGLCFQLPVVLSLAGMAGLVEASTLAKGRRYAIVGIAIVAAVVTPPDPLSQCLLILPIYGLYEISIWCVRIIQFRRNRAEAREIAATQAGA